MVEDIRGWYAGLEPISLRDRHQASSYILVQIEIEQSMDYMIEPPTFQSYGLPQQIKSLLPNASQECELETEQLTETAVISILFFEPGSKISFQYINCIGDGLSKN